MRRDARTAPSCAPASARRRSRLAWLATGSLALFPVVSTFGGEPAAALVAIVAEIDAAVPLAKDAAVLADLQKVRDACRRARKARGDAKAAIAEIQAAREILAGLVGRKGADSPALQGHVAQATKLADAWLAKSAATPKDPSKTGLGKVLGSGVGPSSGADSRF